MRSCVSHARATRSRSLPPAPCVDPTDRLRRLMSHDALAPRLSLRFLRHGATSANQARLRCGGDLDIPLTDLGRQQAAEAAQQVARLSDPIGLIVTSDLQRTRETAAIIAAALPGVPVVIEPAFAERSLGRWNLKPIGETQALLEARCTPPGGESDKEFTERIAKGLRRIKTYLPDRPLLVGSKGVARVMGELVAWPYRLDLGNGEIAEFEFASRPCLETSWSAL